jgi:hypothetical protein
MQVNHLKLIREWRSDNKACLLSFFALCVKRVLLALRDDELHRLSLLFDEFQPCQRAAATQV